MSRPDVLPRVSLTHCADHRLSMVRWARTPVAEQACRQWWGDDRRTSDGYGDLTRHIGAAQMWWVAEDMQLLVEAATLSLPDFPLRVDDIPDPQGVVFYSTPLTGIDSHGMSDLVVNAMSWSAANARPDGTPVLLAYAWVNLRENPDPRVRPGWRCLGISHWEVGTGITDVRADYEPEHAASVIEDRKRLAALWLLASQERIATTTTEPVDRHAAKRHLRADLEIPSTKILRLRHTRKPTSHDAEYEPEARDWTHRWVVSGHWRNQWLPSEDRHRPTWIAPYVKGPEDKPLVLKDTIKALVQ